MPESTVLAVHRCRFVDFTPSAITALAFPPLQLPPVGASTKGKKRASDSDAHAKFGTLALGRANGNIELLEWTGAEREAQSPQAWTVRKTLAGPHPSKVDSLAFAIRFPSTLDLSAVPTLSDLRLFSAGGGSELIEWDLDKSCVRRTLNSQGGAIWSFAVNPAGTQLALGCEDGAVRIFALEHDTLSYARKLDRAKTRLLSVAWGPPAPRTTVSTGIAGGGSDEDEDEDEWEDEWLVAGGSDSALRKWDLKTGRIVERMSTDKVKGERTLVWAVGVLGDGTIVSGDSLGAVKFWDAHTCTQLHSFQGHSADVLCLAISPEGTTLYTSGVDQKITQFSLVQPTTTTSASLRASNRWIQSSSRRLHSHDVRALALWPSYTPLPRSHVASAYNFPADIAPVLASGGIDASLVLTPAALARATTRPLVNPLVTSTTGAFEDAYHRRVAYSRADGGPGTLRVARAARLVMCLYDAGVRLWRLPPRKSGANPELSPEDSARESDSWEKVLEMDLSVQTNLVSGAISHDARWLVVSDTYETKLFAIQHDNMGGLKPRRVKIFAKTLQDALPASSSTADRDTGAASLVFTPDASKLVVATSASAHVLVVDLGNPEDRRPRILRRFDQHRLRAGLARVVRGRMPDASDAVHADVQEESSKSSDTEEGEAEDSLTIPTITRMAISPDGQWLATTDDRCRTHIFNLDSVQHHCVLPSLPQPAQTLAFDPSRPGTLVLGLSNNTFHVFDVEARRFPDWARRLTANLPKRFSHLHDALLGVTFDPSPAPIQTGEDGKMSAPRAALFWGATWICKVAFDAPAGWGGFSKKRRRGQGKTPAEGGSGDVHASNFKLITHYRPMLFVDFIAPGELVVVERPLVDVLAGLPPAYWKPKYGAS